MYVCALMLCNEGDNEALKCASVLSWNVKYFAGLSVHDF